MVGTLRSFDVARGYGFILADHDHRSFFAHVNEFDSAGIAPEPGTRLRFRVATDERGRTRAVGLSELE